MTIYAVSNNKHFLEIPLEILQSLKLQFEIFHSVQEVCANMKDEIPYILILDYEDLSKQEMDVVLDTIKRQYSHNFIDKILVHESESIIDKVAYLSKGINYFLAKPINILELIAYLSTIEQLVHKFKVWTQREIQAKSIENITKLNEHLAEHVKAPIQRFIDFKLSDKLNEREMKEYLVVSRKSAIEVLAAINAVKEQLQEMINHIASNEGIAHLDDMYEKNFLLANAAYGIESDTVSSSE